MKTCKVTLLMILVVFSMVAGAGEVWWGNANQSPTGGNGDWGTASNWGAQVLPGSRDSVGINSNSSPYPTLSSGDYTVTDLLVGYWGDGGMTMSGGNLNISNLFAVGYYGGSGTSNAVFTMDGGVIGGNGAPAQLWIGYHTNAWNPSNGTLNVNDGLINVQWALNVGGGASNTVGHLNIAGGQVNLTQMLNVAAGSNVDISGNGVLSLWNRWGGKSRAQVQAMIASGLITGNGIVGNVQITDFDAGDGFTGFALTAIPEPATMILLGLGGLSLLRRRK